MALTQTPLSGPAVALFNQLRRADGEPNSRKRVKLYQQASIQVMKFLPVVPYVWAGSAVAVRKNVAGYITDPIGPEFMAPPTRNRPTANTTVASDNTTRAHAARG